MNVVEIVFSPTGGTEKVANIIGGHFGGLKNQTAVFVDIYPNGVYNTNTLWGYK